MQQEHVAAVLRDPLAQELLASAIPARLAYTSTDGTPRVIPIGFYWNGAELVFATAWKAPKVASLRKNPRAAVTVDTNGMPPKVLLIRGDVQVEIVDGVPDVFLEASRKAIGEAGMPAFEAQVRSVYTKMAVLTLRPAWGKLFDFETRIPTIVERAIEESASK